jgi:hypothetical protein
MLIFIRLRGPQALRDKLSNYNFFSNFGNLHYKWESFGTVTCFPLPPS